jgi:hypothetical protein
MIYHTQTDPVFNNKQLVLKQSNSDWKTVPTEKKFRILLSATASLFLCPSTLSFTECPVIACQKLYRYSLLKIERKTYKAYGEYMAYLSMYGKLNAPSVVVG